MKKGDTFIIEGVNYTVTECGTLHNGNGRGYFKAISECRIKQYTKVL